MSSNTHYCDIDSLEGLDEAIAFFDGENHGRYDQIVFRVTGCEPLATAPVLLRKVKRAKKKRGSKLSIEGLDELEELRKRAKEVEANKAELECMRAQAFSKSQDPYNSNSRLGDPDHTTTWRHTTDMERAFRAASPTWTSSTPCVPWTRTSMATSQGSSTTVLWLPMLQRQRPTTTSPTCTTSCGGSNYWNNNNPTNNGNEEE